MLEDILQEYSHQLSTQQEVQILTAIIGSSILLMIISMIGISIRIIKRKKREAHNPLGNIKVKTTLPETTEVKESNHILYKNKVLNQADKEQCEQENSVEQKTVNPLVETINNEEPKLPEIENIIPESTIVTAPVSEDKSNKSLEDKKKEVLQAIQETKSREENLRLLEERLRELRGNTPVSTPEKIEHKEDIVEITTSQETIENIKDPLPVELNEVVGMPIKEENKETKIEITSAPGNIDQSPKTFSDWLGSLSGKKRN